MFDFLRGKRHASVPGDQAAHSPEKDRVLRAVLHNAVRTVESDTGQLFLSHYANQPRDRFTIVCDIEHLRHLRAKLPWWKENYFRRREHDSEWRHRSKEERAWWGIQALTPVCIEAAFNADKSIDMVLFKVQDEGFDPPVCLVSVRAKRGATEYEWRYRMSGRKRLEPVSAHDDLEEVVAPTDVTDPGLFENLVADMLRHRGLSASVKGGTADGGIDILAYDKQMNKYVVQCKNYHPPHKVGVKEVRELYAVVQHEGAGKGLLVTSSAFTSAAMAFAVNKPLELVDGGMMNRLSATRPQDQGTDETSVGRAEKPQANKEPLCNACGLSIWTCTCEALASGKKRTTVQCLWPESPPDTGLFAAVESYSILDLKRVKRLAVRGYVANKTGGAVFKPHVVVTLKHAVSGLSVSAETDAADPVLEAGNGGPFEAFFLSSECPFDLHLESGELPPELNIATIEVAEGSDRARYNLPEHLEDCLYDGVRVELLIQASETECGFRVSNIGSTSPEYVQIMFDTLDEEGLYLGTVAALVSASKHGPLLPGRHAVFEPRGLLLDLMSGYSSESPKRQFGTIRPRRLALLPGYARLRHPPEIDERLFNPTCLFDDLDFRRIS